MRMAICILALALLLGSAYAMGERCVSHNDCADDEYCGAGDVCVPIDRPGDTSCCCGALAVLPVVCAAAVLSRR